MSIPLQSDVVYGPVRSRRLGRSLGINVLPRGTKTCNFNCCYCQYGWTPPPSRRNGAGAWPSPIALTAAVEAALGREPRVDRLTLAGNGEPTLYPMLGELVGRLQEVRANRAPQARLAILSNSSTAGEPRVAEALARIDECYMKLDAGDDSTLRAINGSPVSLGRIVDALAGLTGIVLQSMFVRDPGRRMDNTTAARLDRWLEAVARIRPQAVHIYSIDREPAWYQLKSVPLEELRRIARQVESVGIPAWVF
jgi:wyosine [tRNA(Phe)-imidazoG37] synthetase (radical SAM superfamily)